MVIQYLHARLIRVLVWGKWFSITKPHQVKQIEAFTRHEDAEAYVKRILRAKKAKKTAARKEQLYLPGCKPRFNKRRKK